MKYLNYFNGIIINDFNIDINEDMKIYIEEFYGNINYKIFIESCISDIFNNSFDTFINDYNLKISELIGTRGIVEKQEFLINYKMKKYA